MSIRLRLTLIYTVILCVTLAGFGATLNSYVQIAAYKAFQDRLVADAKGFPNQLDSNSGSIASAAADTYFQIRVVDDSGNTTIVPQLQSSNLAQSGQKLPLSSEMLSKLLAGQQPDPARVSVGNQRFLLYNMRVRLRGPFGQFGGVLGILQYARPLSAIDQELDPVRRALFIGGALATLLAFAIGWLLAGLALRPIARITQTAKVIGEAQDFGRRVDYRGPQDEVGRLASTFNAMLGALQAAYQTQRRFVADASHELRTPLTSIRGNIALLQRVPPIGAEDRTAVLDDLAAESERMSRLVADLLTLARADAGRSLRREPVPLAPLVAGLARRLSTVYPDRALRFDMSDRLAVLADPDALLQVLLNLLDNALKFTPPGRLVLLTAAWSQGQVHISVRDSGPGIPPEVLPHLFERFYQADTTRTGTGTGLGLAIARTLVLAQGGTLQAESTLGIGSVFTVKLPAARPSLDADTAHNQASGGVPQVPVSPS
jgi:signal transduction histidine kinase